MTETLHGRLKTLEALVQDAVARIRELEGVNKELKAELAFLEKEAGKSQDSVRRVRVLTDGHERAMKRLRRLRDRLAKLEN